MSEIRERLRHRKINGAEVSRRIDLLCDAIDVAIPAASDPCPQCEGFGILLHRHIGGSEHDPSLTLKGCWMCGGDGARKGRLDQAIRGGWGRIQIGGV